MIQQDPGALYSDHLAVLCRRAEQALARGGFDHLVVPSGTLHIGSTGTGNSKTPAGGQAVTIST